ncbi:DUF4255 domain-containing protein [Aureivirga marina]|uniref:DUF4255 domain-containing protein n=1 Tax=Aureivirga marina TaxID=1182451 RepID=UPI0018CB41DC|nr:DUF4255 domain-containing protein [Aureivirga marina]
MLNDVINIITEELNQFIRLQNNLTEKKVIATTISSQNGSIAIKEENKILLTLVDINKETVVGNQREYIRTENGGFRPKRRDLHLNLTILFSAYFNETNYLEALKYLSNVISFFHAKPVFTTENTSRMANTSIQKLTFHLHHSDSNTKNNMWSNLGAKYMPSVLYKVSMAIFEDTTIRAEIPEIKDVNVDKEVSSS